MLVISVRFFRRGIYRARWGVDPTSPTLPRRNSLIKGRGRCATSASAHEMQSYARLLDAALGQYQPILAAKRGLRIVVIMPPLPSLPDSMVITGSLCSAAARLLSAYSHKIGGTNATLATQYSGPRQGRNARDWTQLTRTHCSMSYRLDRLVEDLRNRRELKGSTRFAARNSKKPRQYCTFRCAGNKPHDPAPPRRGQIIDSMR